MNEILTFLVFLMAFSAGNAQGNQLVTFWGSNGVSTISGMELGLREYCRRGVYDTIILTTLSANNQDSNKDDLPSLNFANHCGRNPLPQQYNQYLKCPQIEDDIKYCQGQGVKILLDIGRSTLWFGFSNQLEAEQFAWKVWNLFLGGGAMESIRTFGNAVLDGINLSLKNSQKEFTIDFVRTLRRIMDEKSGSAKQYLLTASPSCLITNRDPLTPTFDSEISLFDAIYVNFAASICTLNNTPSFNATLQNWLVYARKPNGPDLYIGITASDVAPNSIFVQPEVLEKVYQAFSHRYYRQIKGILLDDAGWDGLKMINGVRYSEKVRNIVKGFQNSPTSSETTTAPVQPWFREQQQQQQQQQFAVRGGKVYITLNGVYSAGYTRKPFHILCFASLVTFCMIFTLYLL